MSRNQRLNEQGQEVPDPTPVTIRFKGRAINQFDQVRQFIREELSRNQSARGRETFEEANDFDVEDDPFPVSPEEYNQDTEESDLETLLQGDPRKKSNPVKPSAPAVGPSDAAPSPHVPPAEGSASLHSQGKPPAGSPPAPGHS